MEVRRCPQRNQRRIAWPVWIWCEPPTPQRDPRTGELTRSSRRRAQPFPLSHSSSEGNRTCLPGSLWSSSRVGATHSVQATGWARSRSFSRSSNLTPNSNESEPLPPSSHAILWESPKRSPPLFPDIVFFRGPERSLDSRSLWRAVRNSWTNGASPIGLRRPSAFWSDLRRGKVSLAFRLHTEPTPRQGSAQVSHSFSQLVALEIEHT